MLQHTSSEVVNCWITTEIWVYNKSSNHSSAIADHVTSTGNNMKWDHFEILVRGRSDTHCKIKETLLIRVLQPSLNENVNSENFTFYSLHAFPFICKFFLLFVTFCFYNWLLKYLSLFNGLLLLKMYVGTYETSR